MKSVKKIAFFLCLGLEESAESSLLLLLWNVGPELHRSGGSLLSAHSLFDLPGDGDERLLNVTWALCGSLQERNVETLCKLLCGVNIHRPLVLKIALVSNQKLLHALTSISVNLFQPLFHVVKCCLVRHVINNNNSVRSSVVRGCDGSESLFSFLKQKGFFFYKTFKFVKIL